MKELGLCVKTVYRLPAPDKIANRHSRCRSSTLKHVRSLWGPSQHHYACSTRLQMKKYRGGGELLTALYDLTGARF